MRVFLVGDIPKFIDGEINKPLVEAGLRTFHESSIEGCREMISLYTYDLLLMDFCSAKNVMTRGRMKPPFSQTPLIVVATSENAEFVSSMLWAGADDFVVADMMDSRELVHRIVAVIRRTKGYSNSRLKIGSLEIDLQERTVICKSRILSLKNLEYEVLECLAINAGKIVKKSTMMDCLYNGVDEPSDRIIDVMICNLRRKILDAGEQNQLIRTSWGQGYLLTNPIESTEFEAVA